jgi:voltage-gated sodium channel
MNGTARRIVEHPFFERFIFAIILLNCVLVGFDSCYPDAVWVFDFRKLVIGIFTAELAIRWTGRNSTKEFFSNGWHWFDIVVVSTGYIPESLVERAHLFTTLRLLRVFMILRLLETVPELALITRVLIRSIRSLSYTGVLFLIFMYLYAVLGVDLFRLKGEFSAGAPDPYGNIFEASFTLFRILTGEDWTDLRYNLLGGVSRAPDWLVTSYHVSWMILSCFLLANLVVGVIINNFDQVMSERKKRAEKESA